MPSPLILLVRPELPGALQIAVRQTGTPPCSTAGLGIVVYCCRPFHWEVGRPTVAIEGLRLPKRASTGLLTWVSHTSTLRTITARRPEVRKSSVAKSSDATFLVTNSSSVQRLGTGCGLDPTATCYRRSIWSRVASKASSAWGSNTSISSTCTAPTRSRLSRRAWAHSTS